MYSLSANEFALLDNNQKIKACENLQNFVESEKLKYFKNENDIPIRPNYSKNNFNNIENNSKNFKAMEDNDLLSSSSLSTFNNERENKINIINRAKNDILECKRKLERLKISPKYTIEENNKTELNTINDDLNNSDTIQEINYFIESTTNSYESDKKRVSINKNYISKNPLNIDYRNNYKKNNKKFEFKNNYNNNENFNKNSYPINSLNYNYNFYNKPKSNKNKLRNEEFKYESNYKNHLYFDYNNYCINKNNSFNKNKNNNIKSINSIKRNNLKEKSDRLKKDLNDKFEKEYIYKSNVNQPSLYNGNNNKSYFYNINEHIKKHLSFEKKLNDEKNDNHSRNNKENKLIKNKSLSNRNKINYIDVGNRLYNMHQVIIDKIIKKKMEIEQKEISDCSFIPRINNKSRKMVEKNKIKNKKIFEIKEKYEKINNNDINMTKKKAKERHGNIIINQKSKIIDLIPKYNKSHTFVNKSKKYKNNKNQKYKNENEEIKECTFKPKINKNFVINYYRNDRDNLKTKYNTIDINMHNPKENKDKFEIEDINKQNNIKQSFLLLNNKTNNCFLNEETFNNNKNEYLEEEHLNLYKDDISKDNKEKIELYYNSKFDSIDKKNEDNKFINYLEGNLTESNNNNYFDNYNFNKRAMSSTKSKNYIINEDNNKFIFPNSFINYNDSGNLTAIPRVYKNKNNIAKFQNKFETTNKIDEKVIHLNLNKNYSFKNNMPIKLKDKEGYFEKLNLNEKNKIEERNKDELIPRRIILTSNNSISSQSIKNNLYHNNNDVYIKKYCRNYSYTNRNKKSNIKDNSKLLYNRMVIKKLLLDE